MLSEQDYERITGRRPSFKDFLSEGESFEGLDFSRDSGTWSRCRPHESLTRYLCARRAAPSTRQPAVKAAVALIPDDDLYLSALIVGEIAEALPCSPMVARKRL